MLGGNVLIEQDLQDTFLYVSTFIESMACKRFQLFIN